MLEGIVRESTVKQATKQLKRDGYLIANIYGAGVENINAAFKKNEFIRYVKNKDGLKFDVKVAGKKFPVVIEAYQKHPVTSDLIHVDLRALSEDKESRFFIPVKPVGRPKGLKNQGVLLTNVRRVKVKCKPSDLPETFEINVEELDVGDNILVRDIQTPKNVKMVSEGRIAVFSVIKAK
ncbi:MAG: large subunit ribosomal protein [Campylobacterota bacterium]|nr:large subunit ribosomal protein [Campylobacterota bacterium]